MVVYYFKHEGRYSVYDYCDGYYRITASDNEGEVGCHGTLTADCFEHCEELV